MHDTMCGVSSLALTRAKLTAVFYVIVLEPLDPVRLVHRILERTEETVQCPFRFLRRIVPITGTTNATIPALKTLAAPVIREGFATPANQSFTVSRTLYVARCPCLMSVWDHAEFEIVNAVRSA